MEHDSAVMRECGQHLEEALTLGRMVLHRSGEEGLDELWGEPFKAFSFAAQTKCETLRTDPEIFDVWTSFAVAAEKLVGFQPEPIDAASTAGQQQASQALELIVRGKDLISYVTRARVPMPKSTREFVERCQRFRDLYVTTSLPGRTRVLRPAPEEEVAAASVSGR